MLFVLRCISEKDFEAVKGKVQQKYKVWLKNFIILFSNTYFSNAQSTLAGDIGIPENQRRHYQLSIVAFKSLSDMSFLHQSSFDLLQGLRYYGCSGA